MTYDQAKELMDKHTDLLMTDSELKEFPYKIKYLLIAPKERSFADRMIVFNEATFTTNNSELALRKLGFFNENLEVYIIGEKDPENREYVDYVLQAYLSGKDQLSRIS